MVVEIIEKLINKFENSFHTISMERQIELLKFASYIKKKKAISSSINLTFICTHNSRRSHMSQIWAQTAAEYYGIPNVNCYSGGTESTAFNPRAVKAVTEAGFIVEQLDNSDNPIYDVYYSEKKEPIKCFSKVYNNKFNPQSNYAAIMTCSHADENCPVVFGAEDRFPIRYDDPKKFDDTDIESEKYSERFEQIGIEMIFTFTNINNGL